MAALPGIASHRSSLLQGGRCNYVPDTQQDTSRGCNMYTSMLPSWFDTATFKVRLQWCWEAQKTTKT